VWLAGRGWKVTGVDFSEVALEQAGGLAAERGVEVEWVHADLLGWRPFEQAFDLVVVLYLQLPGEQLAQVMHRAASGLAPGGTVLVIGHHSDNLEHGSGGPKDPRVLFTPEQIAGYFDGLEIEKADVVLRPVEGERDAIDALVRATRG
jgi:cyclopropane fatty-acyl-phospholipid synthase-like methyltransferase